jgi:hypothetical protein
MNENKNVIYSQPNKYAHPAGCEPFETYLAIYGYQEFFVNKMRLLVSSQDMALQLKQKLLLPYFTRRFLFNRSFLDLGANGGFFSFWAIQQGVGEVFALDADEQYINIVDIVKNQFSFSNLHPIHSNIVDWNEPADIVLALALIHWIYSCTATLGSLDAAVEKLAKLTNYMLIIEWVEPNDEAIQFFHHLDWNKDHIKGPYTLEAFEDALAKHFRRYEKIGELTQTRKLYVAFRTQNEIDLSGPLPLIRSKDEIISSRCLVQDNGIEFWSVLYAYKNSVYKQTTFDLAQREGRFLLKFDSIYFPKVTEIIIEQAYSVVRLEKIDGNSLEDEIPNICLLIETFYDFAIHCLNILDELKNKGVVHRDIRPDNILVRQSTPILLDFGWAISDDEPCFTPLGLGGIQRPYDGSFSDVYSMGMILDHINSHQYPIFDTVISLMTANDPFLRVTDITILKRLFEVAKLIIINDVKVQND